MSRENNFSTLWPAPKFVPKPAFHPSRAGRHWQPSASAAVELELRRARALRRLRGVLNESCGKKKKDKGEKKKEKKEEEGGAEGEREEEEGEEKEGKQGKTSSSTVRLGIGASPLLAFERWMWACSSGSSSGNSEDPVVPRTSSAFEPGLVRSLVRAGADLSDSKRVAALLSGEGRRLSAAIAREAARARASSMSGGGSGGSGKEKKEGGVVVSVEVHKHSLDLCASTSPSPSFLSVANNNNNNSNNKEFIKISRPAYCRLLRAFRECGPEGERPPRLSGVEDNDDDDDDDDAEVEAAAASSSSSSISPRAAFHSRLFAMLLRYKSLAGPGFHASVGAPVCSVLSKTLGTGLEGFASPVNARWARFGCAFADVDAVFGGFGSFFVEEKKKGGGKEKGEKEKEKKLVSANRLLLPAGGSVLVNPPFEPGLLLSAARCCVKAVEEASEKGMRLAVVFVGPRWNSSGGSGEKEEGGGGGEADGGDDEDTSAFLSALSSSSPSTCLEHSFTVPAAQHGYRDGAPHAARDPYRRSPFDSSVFLLRSRAEREKKPLKDLKKWEGEVREAFKLCLPSAKAEERQRAARGATDRKGWGGRSGEGGGGGEGERSAPSPPSSLRASIEARQRLKAERRRGNGNAAPHSALSPSGKRWVKKSKMNSGGGKRKEGGRGGGGGGEAKKQKK